MSNKEHVSREELRSLTHKEVGDEFIIHLVCTHLNTSTYQALNSANLRLMGWTNDAHIESLAFRLLSTGRISKSFRKYFVDVLCGDDIFYTNIDGTEAVLLV